MGFCGRHDLAIMEHFEAEAALAAIQRYKITHSQWVPASYQDAEVRRRGRLRYDVSSLKYAINTAACPVPVKKRMIEWWGPVIYSTQGLKEWVVAINSEEWLA